MGRGAGQGTGAACRPNSAARLSCAVRLEAGGREAAAAGPARMRSVQKGVRRASLRRPQAAAAFWSANLTTSRLLGPTWRPLKALMAEVACKTTGGRRRRAGGGEGRGRGRGAGAGRAGRGIWRTGAAWRRLAQAWPRGRLPAGAAPHPAPPSSRRTCWREAYVRKAQPLERPCERRMASSRMSPAGANSAHRSCSMACRKGRGGAGAWRAAGRRRQARARPAGASGARE